MALKALYQRFRSLRTSLYLMLALLAIFILGQLIPQRSILLPAELEAFRTGYPALFRALDAAGFLRIHSSPLTLAVLGLFFANLALNWVSGLKLALRRVRVDVPPPGMSEPDEEIPAPAGNEDSVIERMREGLRGYRFHREGGRFLAVRNRFGPFGHLLFHLSFIIILAGGLTVYYTRTTGVARVTEGQMFTGTAAEYSSLRPPKAGSPPDIAFMVQDIEPEFVRDEPVQLNASLLLMRQGGPVPRSVGINRPLAAGDTSILIRSADVAPKFRLMQQDPPLVYEQAVVSLKVLAGEMDSYIVPFTKFRLDFVFYPDFAERDGLPYTRSLRMDNPVFRVAIHGADGKVYERYVRPGEQAEAGELVFALDGLALWGEFLIVKERGRWLLVAGFALGMAGLVWRFFFPRVEVRGEYREGRLLVAFRSALPYGPQRREFQSLLERMKHDR